MSMHSDIAQGARSRRFAGYRNAAAIPYILAAAGTAASVVSAQQASSERNQVLNRMLNTQANEQSGMTTIGSKLAQPYEPAAEGQGLSKAAAENTAGLDAAIARAQQTLPAATPTSGNVSGQYTTALAGSKALQDKRNAQLSDLLGKVMAPGQFNIKTALANAPLNTEAARLKTDTGQELGTEQAQYARIEPNPYLTYGGGLLTAAGGAVAGAQSASKINDIYSQLFAAPGGASKVPSTIVFNPSAR